MSSPHANVNQFPGIPAPVVQKGLLLLAPALLSIVLGLVLAGCGGTQAAPPPDPDPIGAPPQQPPAQVEYRLQVGDELSVHVVDQPEFSKLIRVRPDGKLSAPGVGEICAVGSTVSELTEEIRSELQRLIRYPDVSVMLTSHAELLVYVFGEVEYPGPRTHVPNMSALHALGTAGGPTTRAKLSSVLVLRRIGPADVDVYRVDLEASVDGDPLARDMFLQPYDVVFVPRSLIGEVNVFVDQYIRQNIAPFSAYIEGWRAFHINDLNTVIR